ncbi:hypothetical protein ABK040_011999 [Willaertia magna]
MNQNKSLPPIPTKLTQQDNESTNPNEPQQDEMVDIYYQDDNYNPSQFKYFGIGPSCCLEFFVWILSKLTFGIVESFFILRIKQSHVREMVIAGRKLDMNIEDPYLKGTILCIINNIINDFTFGLWYFSGMMHIFYYSEFDKRIFWREEDNGKNQAQQQFKGKSNFKVFSAFPGIDVELKTFLWRTISTIFCLGLMEPWIKAYYYSNLFTKLQFGMTNETQMITVRFVAKGKDLFLRWLKGRIYMILSCGLFCCCLGGFIDDFMNKFIILENGGLDIEM